MKKLFTILNIFDIVVTRVSILKEKDIRNST
jgi:hypothetical protein